MDKDQIRRYADTRKLRRRSAYPANGDGLFEMAGNVWAWTAGRMMRTGFCCTYSSGARDVFITSSGAP